jgi:succinate dehydrogenase / fumarate reductase cytochrome b subunit
LERMALFPGCLVLQRMPQYEKATTEVVGALGIQLENIPRAACCGAPLESFSDRWLHFAAYNLSLAERMGLDMVTLCGNCANTLLRAKRELGDPSLRLEVNAVLSKLGLHYEGKTDVKHLLQLLLEHLDQLRERMSTELALKVAVTHPCQAFRPHELTGFDDPLEPQAMRRIVALTGAELAEYIAEHDCCGSTLYLADKDLGLEAGRRKLASAASADVLVDACGNCQLLLERFRGLYDDAAQGSRMVVLTLPQVLGLAMGIDAANLGISAASARVLARGLA